MFKKTSFGWYMSLFSFISMLVLMSFRSYLTEVSSISDGLMFFVVVNLVFFSISIVINYWINRYMIVLFFSSLMVILFGSEIFWLLEPMEQKIHLIDEIDVVAHNESNDVYYVNASDRWKGSIVLLKTEHGAVEKRLYGANSHLTTSETATKASLRTLRKQTITRWTLIFSPNEISGSLYYELIIPASENSV